MNLTPVLRQTARQWGMAWACSLVLVTVMLVMSATTNVPVRDPDNVLPGYIRFPLIVVGVIALDVVPRVVARMVRGKRSLREAFSSVMAERWPRSHWWFAANGIAAWYVCYAAFRNVKSLAPIANPTNWDDRLADMDRFLLGGHDPAQLLHSLLGQGFAAHLLSDVYFLWIALVPVSIGIALVWSRTTTAGAWYVTALCIDWLLGALLYFAVPTLGPVYSDPETFAHLPHTYVTELAQSLLDGRTKVMADPTGYDGLQTIAAFPSLHVGIMVTITLTLMFIPVHRLVRIAAWVMLGLTVLATIYLGWHFLMDVFAGAVLGAVAVWLAALGTGNHIGWRPVLMPTEQPDPVVAASDELTTQH